MHHQGKRHFAHAVAVRRFVFVIGTRPEVIKVAPIIRRLSETNWASVRIVTTGQQSDLLEQTLSEFGLRADSTLR